MTYGRLPVVSGRVLIKWLERLDYHKVRQAGSHVRMERKSTAGTHSITVPWHSEIAKGTLNDILGSVGRSIGREKADLISELSDF